MGCWGGGGAVAVMEKRRGRAGAGDGYGGCYGAETALLRAKEAGKTKNGRWALRANVGELKAHPGRPGHGGQGVGDARPVPAPRGGHGLNRSATESIDLVRSATKCRA